MNTLIYTIDKPKPPEMQRTIVFKTSLRQVKMSALMKEYIEERGGHFDEQGFAEKLRKRGEHCETQTFVRKGDKNHG